MVYGRYINTPTMLSKPTNITGGAQPGKSASLRVPAAGGSLSEMCFLDLAACHGRLWSNRGDMAKL